MKTLYDASDTRPLQYAYGVHYIIEGIHDSRYSPLPVISERPISKQGAEILNTVYHKTGF